MPRTRVALRLCTAVLAAQVTTCPGSGLSVTGGRLGDPFSLALDGPPGAAALLASDAAPGPVMTPFGPVCFGLTPALATSAMILDANGHFGLTGMLPLVPPLFALSTQFLQAGFAHPSIPGGFALTNGAAVTFRPPRLFVLSDGTTDTVVGIDAATDAVALSTTAPIQIAYDQFVRIPRRGWIGWTTPTGSFYWIDGAAGTLVTTLMLPAAVSNNSSGQRPAVVLGNFLYAGTYSGVIKIDTVSHTLVAGPTPVTTNLHHFYGAGPGSAGTAVWGADYDAATNAYTLIEVSPATLAVSNTYPLPGQPLTVRPSAGGTEVLIETFTSGAFQIHALRTSPHQLTTVLPAVSAGGLTVLRSGTLTKAYARTPAPSSSLVSFQTDPASPSSGVPVPLPPLPPFSPLHLVSN